MSNDAKHPCAGATRAGRPCKNVVHSSQVFCDAHRPRLTYEDAGAVSASLRELGVLKEGERAAVVHTDPLCKRLRDRSQPCTCQRVELVWPDYNEMRVEAAR